MGSQRSREGVGRPVRPTFLQPYVKCVPKEEPGERGTQMTACEIRIKTSRDAYGPDKASDDK